MDHELFFNGVSGHVALYGRLPSAATVGLMAASGQGAVHSGVLSVGVGHRGGVESWRSTPRSSSGSRANQRRAAAVARRGVAHAVGLRAGGRHPGAGVCLVAGGDAVAGAVWMDLGLLLFFLVYLRLQLGV